MENRVESHSNDVESIKEVFRGFDHKQDKTIPREKLLQVLLNLNPAFDRQALVNLLELSDVVNDDDVRYEEFVDFVRPQPENGGFAIASSEDGRAAAAAEVDADAEAEAAEQQKIRLMQTKPRRASVKAPKITDNEMKDYKKPVHPKDAAAKEFLAETLTTNAKLEVLCGSMIKDAKAREDIINAFYAKEFADGTDIICQGAQGDCLYIIATGSVDIFVNRGGQPSSEGKIDKGGKVCTWNAGALFGELALMYQSPRAATVSASGPVSTWVLDGLDFKMMLMQAGNEQLKSYEGWLRQVKLLEPLNGFELSQLADIMQSDCFADNDDIIVQGEAGDKFFILEDGTASAFINGDAGEKEVKEYLAIGDFFGEIALLTNEPRRATVRATGQGCSVAYVTQEDFTAILGPITDKLKEEVDKYPQYAKFLKN